MEAPVIKRKLVAHSDLLVRSVDLRYISIEIIDGLIIELEQPDLFCLRGMTNGQPDPVRCVDLKVLVLIGVVCLKSSGISGRRDVAKSEHICRIDKVCQLIRHKVSFVDAVVDLDN